MYYLAMAVGALGIIANIIIYQQKSRKNLLVWKLTSDVLWGVHYLLLAGYTGAAVSLIAIIRELVFLNKDKKWAQSNWWLVGFLCASACSAVLTWKNAFSLLPAIASMIAIVSFWMGKPNRTRYLAFAVSACMITYGIYLLSPMVIINETLTITSSAIGCYRYRKSN